MVASQYHEPQRARRTRFSPWTVLAPIALVAVVMMLFNALGESCALRDCAVAEPATSAKAGAGGGGGGAAATPAKGQKAGKAKGKKAAPKQDTVKPGDNLGTIAAKVGLTTEELEMCNPSVDPRALQPGDVLLTAPGKCKLAPAV